MKNSRSNSATLLKAKEMRFKEKIKTIATATNAAKDFRRPSLPAVFDRLNISPCHKICSKHGSPCSSNSEVKGKGFGEAISNNFYEEKTSAINLKKINLENVNQEEKKLFNPSELLRNLIDILDQMDQETPPNDINLDDYKDYLIWKLCRKVKSLMKKKEAASSANKFVSDIHQKIARTLSNIETQLKDDEEGDKEKNKDVQEKDSEPTSKELIAQKEKQNLVKQLIQKEKDEVNSKYGTLNELETDRDKKSDEINNNFQENNHHQEKANKNNENEKKYDGQNKKDAIFHDKKTIENGKNLDENHNALISDDNKEKDEGEYEKNCKNDKETQTSTQTYDEPPTSYRYPSQFLISSLEKIKKHQVYYEALAKENDEILTLNQKNKINDDNEELNNDLTVIKPEKRSPLTQNSLYYLKTSPQAYHSQRHRDYIERQENKYKEILEILSQAMPHLSVTTHWVFKFFINFL